MNQPTAREVILAALIARLPVPEGEERPLLDDRADLIVQALIQHGHLPDPTEPPVVTLADVEGLAQWLAGESRHPRYVNGEGWRRILQSRRDVDMASASALRGPATRETEERVASAASTLTRWIDEHPPDPEKP